MEDEEKQPLCKNFPVLHKYGQLVWISGCSWGHCCVVAYSLVLMMPFRARYFNFTNVSKILPSLSSISHWPASSTGCLEEALPLNNVVVGWDSYLLLVFALQCFSHSVPSSVVVTYDSIASPLLTHLLQQMGSSHLRDEVSLALWCCQIPMSCECKLGLRTTE